MLLSKSKSGARDISNKKTSPATLKVINRITRTGSTKSGSSSPSPLQNPRSLVDRSLKSVASKPTVERRSLGKQTRAPKASELQVQLDAVQEELKIAREQLVSVEQEKARAPEESKDARKSADEANEKLAEALLSKKRVNESSEVAFRADELYQTGAGAGRKREEEWQKEFENERNEHAADVAALFAATQELERVRNELALASEEKNTALSHANDAMKTAEINADNIESLSREVIRVRAWLESEMESASNETAGLIRIWESKVDPLSNAFGKAKAAEEKLAVMEALVEGLRTDVTDAKRAETEASKLAEEWKRTTELLGVQVEDSNQYEKPSLDYLASVTKQLEERNSQLQDADSDMSALRGKIRSLEVEAGRCRTYLEESDRRLELAQLEATELDQMVEAFKSKFQMLEEENLWAMNNVNITAADNEILMEERSKLINEVHITRDEGEKTKKAMEGLASALHEVSTKARETQEMLLTKQIESEDSCAEIEELKSSLKKEEERYEIMLDEARYEIVCLRNANQRYLTEADTSRTEREAKEINFSNSIKRSEEELAAFKVEMETLANTLKGVEHEARAAKEDGVQKMTKLRQAESEAASAKEAAEEAMAESFRFKERLLDQENELQSITHENDGLHIREAAALEKITELTALLGEVRAKRLEEIGVQSNNKNVYDLLPETMKFHEENTIKSGAVLRKHEERHIDYRKPQENENGSFRREENSLKVESFRDIDKDQESERVHKEEKRGDELESKTDIGSFDWVNRSTSEKMDNGSLSPSKSQQQKKKMALLHKFGNLVKKKKKGNHK